MSGFEVVKDFCVEMTVYGRRMLASPATDSVIRFANHEYDYLRYLDPDQSRITCEFLGQQALSELVGLGIPDSRERLKMTEMEYAQYLEWQDVYHLGDFERDLSELPDATPEEIAQFFGYQDLQTEIDGFFDGPA